MIPYGDFVRGDLLYTFDENFDWYYIEPVPPELVVDGITYRRREFSLPMMTVRDDRHGATSRMRHSGRPLTELELDRWVRTGCLPVREEAPYF